MQSAVGTRLAAPERRAEAVRDLAELCAIPSVSSAPEHAKDVRRAAEWLAARLRRAGLQRVGIEPGRRHPVVWGSWTATPPRGRCLLIYGHYDVQPPGPRSAWTTDPFGPVVRDGALVARGAADDKGPLLCHVHALEAWLRRRNRLPVDVLVVLDGEEEIGSPSMPGFLSRHPGVRRVTSVVISDTRMASRDRPALVYSLRGGASLDITLRTAPAELHSGAFGGAAPDAGRRLAELLAGLWTADERLAVPGLERHLPARSERRLMRRHGPSDEELRRSGRLPVLSGEPGFTGYERTTIRAALVVTGITSGHQGPGAKGVVPATATARLNLRLPPGQDPHAAVRALATALQARSRPGEHLTLRGYDPSWPVELERAAPIVRAAATAATRAFGVPPALLRSGGSIPVVAELSRTHHLPIALLGFAAPDDRVHGPDERFPLVNLRRGTTACIELYRAYALHAEQK